MGGWCSPLILRAVWLQAGSVVRPAGQFYVTILLDKSAAQEGQRLEFFFEAADELAADAEGTLAFIIGRQHVPQVGGLLPISHDTQCCCLHLAADAEAATFLQSPCSPFLPRYTHSCSCTAYCSRPPQFSALPASPTLLPCSRSCTALGSLQRRPPPMLCWRKRLWWCHGWGAACAWQLRCVGVWVWVGGWLAGR